MITGRQSLRSVGSVLILVAASLAAAASLTAQVRLRVDSRSSLAWWQVTPHMGHLWATTCPQDSNWYTGNEHSPGFRYDFKRDPGAVHDMKAMRRAPVPMFPRSVAAPVCTPAVRGEVSAPDTTTWRGVRGLIVVRADALVTGLNMRDDYSRQRVMQTDTYPDIRFEIDSLMSVQKGDTLRATAVGVLELHGVKRPWVVPIEAWREPLGLRVTGKFSLPAPDLVSVYRMSKYPLSLGIGMRIWELANFGIDAILVEATRTASGGSS